MRILILAIGMVVLFNIPAFAQTYGYDGNTGAVDRQYMPAGQNPNPVATPTGNQPLGR